MKNENVNKEELLDKTVIYLADDEFRKRLLTILKDKYKLVLTEFIFNKKTCLEIGNALNSPEKAIQNMLLKITLAIVNLYEKNDYLNHEDLTLKIYFDICLNARNLVTDLNIENIDFILRLMPQDVCEKVHNLYYPLPRTNKGKRLKEKNAYHVIKFHVKRYELIPEIYFLLEKKDLFIEVINNLNSSEKHKTNLMDRYINCSPYACNNSALTKAELAILEVVRDLPRSNIENQKKSF